MKTKPVYEAVYNAFADIYDEVMRDVDYASWARHIINLADRFEIQVDKILELACGTGSLAIHLAQLDFAITGIDRSEAMLHHAKEKSRQEGVSIPFHAASMQSFSSVSLDQDFDLILCLYDSLNYLLNEEDIHATFQEVTAHLRPGGAFIFDVTTEYNLLHNFSGFTFAENFETASYIWENEYDILKKICASKVTIFTQKQGVYERHIETHNQRVYTNEFLVYALEKAGLETLGLFHNLTENPVQKKCERIHFVCKK